MSPQPADLGTAELEVLKTLWEDGPATVREVLDRLRRRGRDLAYTTVQTFLSRLEQKGFVASNRAALAYVYRPKVSREKISRRRLKSLVEELYDGAAAPLVLQLVRDERFTPDEIAELQSLIEKLETRPRPSRSARRRTP